MKQNKAEKQITTYFDHNFFKSKRIDFRFCTLAKLEKLNNFYLYRIEDYPNKKSRNRDFRLYLARARARPALASAGASGPYPEGIVKIF